MQNQSIQSELSGFVQFASRRVESGDSRLSIEELVRQWRQGTEQAETLRDVRQGIIDDAQGRARPAADVFAEVRRKLGL